MAGERVVLAYLEVNADGTVTGVARAQDAISGLEKTTRDGVGRAERAAKSGFDKIGLSTKRLLDGFFNIRQAIRGLFLGFSVGTAVLALGNLIQETITASDWFKRAKESAVDFFRSIVLNETQAEAAVRHLSDSMKELGLRGSAAILADMEKVKADIAKAQQALRGIPTEGKIVTPPLASREGPGFLQATGEAKGFDVAIELNAEQRKNTLKDLAALELQLQKLQAEYDNLGVAVTKTEGPVKAVTSAAKEQAQTWDPMVGEALVNVGHQFDTATEQQFAMVDSLAMTREELYELELQAIRTSAAYSLMAAGVTTFASALVESAAAQDLSGRKILASVLKAIAVEAAARGSFYILEGIARGLSSYGFDPTATGLIATGLKFLALGAALGAAAGAVGGGQHGGSGGSASRGSREAPAAPEAAPPKAVPNITVVIDGVLPMTSKEQLARDLMELLREAQTDGA